MKLFKSIFLFCLPLLILWCFVWLVKGGVWTDNRIDLYATLTKLSSNITNDFTSAFQNCRFYFRKYVGTNWSSLRLAWSFTPVDSLSALFKNISQFFLACGSFIGLVTNFFVFIIRAFVEIGYAYIELIYYLFDFVVNPVIVPFNSYFK